MGQLLHLSNTGSYGRIIKIANLEMPELFTAGFRLTIQTVCDRIQSLDVFLKGLLPMKNQNPSANTYSEKTPEYDRRFLFDDDENGLPVDPSAENRTKEMLGEEPEVSSEPPKPKRVGQVVLNTAASGNTDFGKYASRRTFTKAEKGYQWVDDEDVVYTSSHDPENSYDELEEKPHEQPKPVKRRWPWICSAIAGVLVFLYCFVVFFPTPFVKKWRNIWIETAMSTMTHQWLATAFFPKSLIDDILYSRYLMQEEQKDMTVDKDLVSTTTAATLGTLRPSNNNNHTEEHNFSVNQGSSDKQTDAASVQKEEEGWLDPNHPLYRAYPEIDVQSFYEYVRKHGSNMYDKDGYLVIDAADRDSKGTSIKTKAGDTVKALDTRNGIIIASVSGDGYKGLIAIVRDPAQVSLAVSKNYGSSGQRIPTLCERNNAVLGINASGFVDPDGKGNGGEAYGYVLSKGKEYHEPQNNSWFVMGFDHNNIFSICSTKKFSAKSADLRDAMEFQPLLVNNGKIVCTVNDGWGINPRAGIGQCADGSVLLAVVDGRSSTSLGCRGIDMAEIFYRYGAVQAANVDGGSSAVMYYNGRVISNPSGQNKTDGRLIPDAWVVKRAK